MNFINEMKKESHVGYTENGALVYNSTMNAVYDLFAKGGSMRQATDAQCIDLFKEAYDSDPTLALRCLFYLRDARGGQGERRFFRLAIKWLATHRLKEVLNLIDFIPEYGRWDDLYSLFDTAAESTAIKYMKEQFFRDYHSDKPSLLAKWLKSENTSSRESQNLARQTREGMNLTPRLYRKMLSDIRARLKVLEVTMSANKWNDIEFDKVPSGAGLKYRNAFQTHLPEKYEKFINDKESHFHTSTLYPYEIVRKALENFSSRGVQREAINKYWDDLKNYFDKNDFNALVVADTSGSMCCGGNNEIHPIDVAISLALYAADKCVGPFKNHFISFSSRPQLIETSGYDFVEKCYNIYRKNLCENTNIKATFDLILNTAVRAHMRQEDLPKQLIIISDMQFDRGCYNMPLMDEIAKKWRSYGYVLPHLIYWNVNGSYANSIPMIDDNGATYVSGASPTIFQMVASGKTGIQLMLDILNSERYSQITSVC